MTTMQRENDKLKGSHIDIEMKSMSKNLMFYNIPEPADEKCLTSTANIMNDTMKLDNSD